MPLAARHRRPLALALVLALAGIALTLAIRAWHFGRAEPPPAAPVAASSPGKKPPARPSQDVHPQVQELADRTDLSAPQKIEALLAAAPGLTPDDRLPALHLATELIADEDFPKYRLRLLQLADTPELRDLIAHDALSRGEEIGLPVLLDVLRLAAGEEERRDIRDLLEAYLDHDYGPDADDWEKPVKSWLAAHAGEQ